MAATSYYVLCHLAVLLAARSNIGTIRGPPHSANRGDRESKVWIQTIAIAIAAKVSQVPSQSIPIAVVVVVCTVHCITYRWTSTPKLNGGRWPLNVREDRISYRVPRNPTTRVRRRETRSIEMNR
ncbi:hypothetical protein C8F01DRAFT_746056 [Mycena amicta]|nr:hypothetical protein C8F01DRAFT_746056 [Mycena amicta]